MGDAFYNEREKEDRREEKKWFALFQKLNDIYREHGRRIAGAAFVSGFLWDTLTLSRIDLFYENLVFIAYLFVAALGIAIRNLYHGGALRGTFFGSAERWMPVFIQFAFGGLFSAFFIFYTRSASVAESWPFLLFLAFLLVGNEFFKKRYLRFTFQVSIFFVTFFSYMIFAVPVLLGTMGAFPFLLSGTASIAAVSAFIYLLSLFVPHYVRASKNMLITSIAGIFVTVNVFYFTNLIPPIPLSLKDAGVYHRVTRIENGNYRVLREKREWYEFYKQYDSDFHGTAGEPVYLYSSVFAPTRLNTIIFHEWRYFDTARQTWIMTDRLSFPIVGGRDGGYRGYSVKENAPPGRWLVFITTSRGQVLGRVSFEVVRVAEPAELETYFR